MTGGFNKQLTANIDLAMMCYSETAQAAGLLNLPHAPEIVENLSAVAERVIEPIIDAFNLPVTITSGYRGPALNALIGGRADSQHLTGEAVDIVVGGVLHDMMAEWMISALDFDELILEKFDPAKSEFGWIHCSYAPSGNRRKVSTFDGETYHDGLVPVGVRDDRLTAKIKTRYAFKRLDFGR